MYHEGKGVPQDSREALKWYRLAADRGTASAQLNLGFMYDRGNGVPQNYVQAYMWYSLAGTSGSAKGPNNRDLIAPKMTPAQIAEAQRLAREWKPHVK
jgi:TPR repeat protein